MKSAHTMKPADLVVSFSPHVHCGNSVPWLSYQVLLALVPASIAGVSLYGWPALKVIAASIASAMIAEAVIQRLFRRPITLADGSAAVSGALLAMILPPGVPLYVIIVANFIGIAVAKQMFGGYGSNPLNPALVAWAVIRVTETWAGFLDYNLMALPFDLPFSPQDPLGLYKATGISDLSMFSLHDLFMGHQLGGIGASAIAWILVGGLYLTIRGVIRWQIPLAFLLGITTISGIFWLVNPEAYANPAFHLLTGNVMIGAFFLSTDHPSSPVNAWAMAAFGFGCGALTIVLRTWSVYPDGVVFACLLMSLSAPLLDRLKSGPLVVHPAPAKPSLEEVAP